MNAYKAKEEGNRGGGGKGRGGEEGGAEGEELKENSNSNQSHVTFCSKIHI